MLSYIQLSLISQYISFPFLCDPFTRENLIIKESFQLWKSRFRFFTDALLEQAVGREIKLNLCKVNRQNFSGKFNLHLTLHKSLECVFFWYYSISGKELLTRTKEEKKRNFYLWFFLADSAENRTSLYNLLNFKLAYIFLCMRV